jgi:hypothetical protein
MDETVKTPAPEVEVDEGGASSSSFYDQPYPRVNLWKETITLLRDSDCSGDKWGSAYGPVEYLSD